MSSYNPWVPYSPVSEATLENRILAYVTAFTAASRSEVAALFQISYSRCEDILDGLVASGDLEETTHTSDKNRLYMVAGGTQPQW